jgi:probable phosphoglycerate mutase
MPPPEHDHYRKLILIRHGESTTNQERRLTGQIDPALTQKGIRQAQNAARFIFSRHRCIDMVYTSPLLRTVHTARIIAERLDVPLIRDDLLIETDFGAWEGLGRDELKRKSEWRDYVSDPFHFSFPGGESPQDVKKRVRIFMEKIFGQTDWNSTVIVSHYTPIAFLILQVMGDGNKNRAPFTLDNASISILFLSGAAENAGYSGYIETLNCIP